MDWDETKKVVKEWLQIKLFYFQYQQCCICAIIRCYSCSFSTSYETGFGSFRLETRVSYKCSFIRWVWSIASSTESFVCVFTYMYTFQVSSSHLWATTPFLVPLTKRNDCQSTPYEKDSLNPKGKSAPFFIFQLLHSSFGSYSCVAEVTQNSTQFRVATGPQLSVCSGSEQHQLTHRHAPRTGRTHPHYGGTGAYNWFTLHPQWRNCGTATEKF